MTNETITAKDIRYPDAPLTVLTCYDYMTAKIMDQVDSLDMILVGDSLGMVTLGHDSTIPVTVDDMVHHTSAVNRAVERAFLCTDLPFLAVAESKSESVAVAKRLMQDGGAQAVKVEGGERNASIIDHLTKFDVPVVGHLGLTPQSVEAFGGYHVQGQTREKIQELVRDALMLQESGVIALVLECVPGSVASALTDRIDIPTIGIGAGDGCDGQVLVWQDMLGKSPEDTPRFVKEWDDLSGRIREGVESFCREVRDGTFPEDEHSFGLGKQVNVSDVREWVDSV